MERMTFLVFIPLGHTIWHFPHNMQERNWGRADFSSPLLNKRIPFLRFIVVKFPAVQLAAHDPQAIHLRTSGSLRARISKRSLFASSRLMTELGVNEYPKLIIILMEFNLFHTGMSGLTMQHFYPLLWSLEGFWALYKCRHRKSLF